MIKLNKKIPFAILFLLPLLLKSQSNVELKYSTDLFQHKINEKSIDFSYFDLLENKETTKKEPFFNNIYTPLKFDNKYHLAFFCRLEVEMEKAANFPVKFRIGEVQYVEKMEGKY